MIAVIPISPQERCGPGGGGAGAGSGGGRILSEGFQGFGILKAWVYRNDAGLAAAELALAAEAAALRTGAPDTVATAGRVDLAPNTVNSVPREVPCRASF